MDNGDRVSVDGWKLVVGFVNDSKGFEVAKVVMVGCMEPKVQRRGRGFVRVCEELCFGFGVLEANNVTNVLWGVVLVLLF